MKHRKENIINARTTAEEIKLERYEDHFNDFAKKDYVVLAEVSTQELESQNKQIEEFRKKEMKENEKEYNEHQQELMRLQEESKDEIVHRSELMRAQVIKAESENIHRIRRRKRAMQKGFYKAEGMLKKNLRNEIGQIQDIYRDMNKDENDTRHNLAGNQDRTENMEEFAKKKQYLQVNVRMLRCVKDKIPKGRYCILVSILDRMGGNVISLKKRQTLRITTPVVHSGEYHLNNLRFNTKLTLIAPARANIRPSMVWLFELFMLKSKEYTHDQVLGWGVFPLIDSEFELIKGNFKVNFRKYFSIRFQCFLEL